MPWQLQYIDDGGNAQNLTFAQLAALEGARNVGDAWQASFLSHKSSRITLKLPGVPPHIAPAIPFESRVKIIDPTGTVQFSGFRTDRTSTGEPNKSFSSYVFEDEWYFLDHVPYCQQWLRTAANGSQSVVPFQFIVLYQPNSNQVYNPQPLEGQLITDGQQMVDILNWAISQGAHLQIGEIDLDFYQAWYPVQNLKCGDALRHCLRLHPGVFTEIDCTTNPPTFHARARTGLLPLNLPYSYTDALGRRHTALDIQPRPELQPKRVALFYRVISGKYTLETPVDIYPFFNYSVLGPALQGQSIGGAAEPYTVGGLPVRGTLMNNINQSQVVNVPVGAPGGLRAMDFAIDLQGPKGTATAGKITSLPFNPTLLDWWRRKVPSLKQVKDGGNIPNDGLAGNLQLLSTNINDGGTASISVKDGAGNLIDIATYAFVLEPKSSPHPWMTVGGVSGAAALAVIEATITAHFNYTTQTPGESPVVMGNQIDHVHHIRVKLCNSASFSQTFTQITNQGEAIPPNLAQNVYAALAMLQYSFTHSIVEKSPVAGAFNGWIKPGKHAINLTGPLARAEWAAMLATAQQTDYKMHLDGAGNTFDNFTVKCGPVEHLEPGQLVQLFNVFANRDLTKIDANEKFTGTPSPGNTVDAPSDTAQENSVPGVEIPQQAAQVSFTTPGDPTTAPTGQINSDAGLVAGIVNGKTPIGGGTPQGMMTMQPREFAVCDNAGNVYFSAVHATQGHTTA